MNRAAWVLLLIAMAWAVIILILPTSWFEGCR